MNLNQRGIDLIRQCEGCKLEPYQDVAGLWTIGIGHLVKDSDPYHPNGPVMTISQEEADALLLKDLGPVLKAVREAVKVPINDNQFSALVSFAFNVGVGAFENSTLLRKLNAGNMEGAETEFLKWDKVNGKQVHGLTTRRHLESMLFSLPI